METSPPTSHHNSPYAIHNSLPYATQRLRTRLHPPKQCQESSPRRNFTKLRGSRGRGWSRKENVVEFSPACFLLWPGLLSTIRLIVGTPECFSRRRSDRRSLWSVVPPDGTTATIFSASLFFSFFSPYPCRLFFSPVVALFLFLVACLSLGKIALWASLATLSSCCFPRS